MKHSGQGSTRFLLLALLLVLLAGAGVAWAERTALMTWYVLRGLKRAGDGDVQAWARRAAGIGRPAVPDLLRLLADEDTRVCGNAHQALDFLAGSWGRDDPRTLELLDQIVEAFPRLSAPARTRRWAWPSPGRGRSHPVRKCC